MATKALSVFVHDELNIRGGWIDLKRHHAVGRLRDPPGSMKELFYPTSIKPRITHLICFIWGKKKRLRSRILNITV
jgi:hypothetical protein